MIADEAWEIDHFLHENPELKRSPYAWLTDFVGWLPVPDGGPAEAALTADYNAEMVEHVARYPRLRDRSVFVGEPEDLVTRPFGPGLPTVRDWTREHFAFAGWVSTGRPAAGPRAAAGRARVATRRAGLRGDRRRLRGRHRPAAPGRRGVPVRAGAGAGAADGARRPGPASTRRACRCPTASRSTGTCPTSSGMLAACDVAVVQGGLTTTMELAEAGRPFLYFPLAHHFEQQIHVPHRLDRLGAGTRMEYATATPESIAAAIAEALATPVRSAPIAGDGAARAAELLASLLDRPLTETS